ncbi:MAG: hypothetical protein JST86_14125 [Bacteroidetes bacterium]|nr:hypothetical protein [Bacteroidota bacterium]
MDNREDKILNSLEGLHKATAPDFFYTRLKGRMQREMEAKRPPLFLLKPAFAAPVLFIILLVNVFSIVQFNRQPGKVAHSKAAVSNQQPATIESFAEAYNLNTESVYE